MKRKQLYPVDGAVHSGYDDAGAVKTAARSEDEERREAGVVTMTDTVVDPRTMVVHLHHTPVPTGVQSGIGQMVSILKYRGTTWYRYQTEVRGPLRSDAS